MKKLIGAILFKSNSIIVIGMLIITAITDITTIVTYLATNIRIDTSLYFALAVLNVISITITLFSKLFSQVPNVEGLMIGDARALLQKCHLKCPLICDEVFVLKQEPKANDIVRRGKKVKLKTAVRIDDNNVKVVNVALDELAESLVASFHKSLAYSGSKYSFNKKKMTIVNGEGNESIVEVVFSFEFMDNHNEYIVYSDGLYPNGIPDLSFSRIIRKNGKCMLDEIADENDWRRIRTLMRYLANDKDPLRPVRYDENGIEIIS